MAQLNPNELAIRKTSVQLNIAESLVEKVIGFKWKTVHEAQYGYTSIEDSGLGTFKVRPFRVIAKIRKIESYIQHMEKELQDGTEITEARKERHRKVIEKLLEEKQYLESKI